MTKEELSSAIKGLVEQLGISGSVAGVYNLYTACFAEWAKAKEGSDSDNEKMEVGF